MFPKKGESVPKIRFPGLNDKWETRRLGDVVEISRGLTYKPQNVSKSGVRVLRSSNISDDTFKLLDNDIFVTEDVVKNPLVNNGDILVTAANGSTRLVGKHAIVKNIISKTIHGGFMLLIRSNYNYFINSWMGTSNYKRILSLVRGGNGAIGNLSKPMLETAIILIPTEEEQRKIGNFFKELDSSITLQEQKIESLKQMKKAFLQKMFV